ncbi:hypothetical protein CMV_018750 [Castanea mollissima]|uniref:Acid phosphatase/vanadium-dependent haloperoxidase-related protein n=1 Tax=Castanea mollissima TaxID=60419 RepID=A0A8J4VPB5_9ROSI|nr:hypothetical protein CMV_018750 [Castanea mollissima]
MLSQCFCWSFPTCSYSSIHHHNLNHSTNKKQQQPFLLFLRLRQPKPKSSPFKLTCLGAGTGTGTGTELFDQISQLAHNKVLVAAGISAAIGQLSKPFTSVLLYGKDLDFKAALQAGGFPSTHSSAVVATATIIALERGLSDSIFGLTVVYAGLIMYDAQGVRREVGNHAKVLNKVLAKIHVNSVHTKDRENMIDSQPGTSLPYFPGISESMYQYAVIELPCTFLSILPLGKCELNAPQLIISRLAIICYPIDYSVMLTS